MTEDSELRRAAKLMREHAEAATQGPWAAWVMGSEGYLILRKDGTLAQRGKSRVARVGLKDWDSDKADAEYIAGMHPGVALAVADWLDVEAGILEKGLPDPTGGWAEARAVARAYLGT